MRLKLQLPAKAGQFRISECEATRLLTLSANDFQTFLNWPQKELSWDAQPLYYEEDGKRVYRGVLILGEGRADGVFAYDAGEHFVYLPGARAVVDSILEQAVEKIIKEGTENTNEGSWCYYFSELYEQMGLVIEDGNGFDALLLEKLEQRPEAAEVALTDECFDICYYLNYCRNLSDEEIEGQIPLARQSELFRKSVSVFCDMYDEKSDLYEMLHNNLGMSDDEIGYLGFALHDEYVDEQIDAEGAQSGHFPESGKLANLISAYEELHQLPDEERITHSAPGTFGYCLDPDVPSERLHAVYQQALSALELKGDEIQIDGQFTSRDEIISRMRDCLLAKELSAGERVLFVATEPYGGPGDFALRGGVIESGDEQDKTCSVRGTFFTMEKVPLHYVLGRYNPAVGGEYYGFRGIVPYFCEDKELAEHYLHEAEVMWDAEMEVGQDLSM